MPTWETYLPSTKLQLTNVEITVNKTLHKIKAKLAPIALIVTFLVASCNSKETATEEFSYTVSNVAVKDFSLTADKDVLTDLDSVFFSIDLDHGVIFNADSLPLGTDISRLIPVITFATTMSKAEIVMSGGSEPNDTVNYLENATDSIDFTRNVKLNVTAYDKETTRSYLLKVNVHTQKPDSLMWDHLAVTPLASRFSGPKSQKTVSFKGEALSVIEERDGTFTLSSAKSIFYGNWTKKVLSLPFTPDLASLTASPESLWMLDSDGNLMTSPDGESWSSCGVKWISIIGPYLDSVLGLKQESGTTLHDSYPSAYGKGIPAHSDFPVKGRSQSLTYTTPWSPLPIAITAGGVTASGTVSSATWAFDGDVWTEIDNVPFPAVEGAALVRYTSSVGATGTDEGTVYDALYLLSGRLADGSSNRNLYISLDNGVTWKEGGELTKLPAFIPALYGADVIVQDEELNADLSKDWTAMPSSSPGRWLKPFNTVNGTEIFWNCPYIYIIGGTIPNGSLSDTIWRGATARLAFVPII